MSESEKKCSNRIHMSGIWMPGGFECNRKAGADGLCNQCRSAKKRGNAKRASHERRRNLADEIEAERYNIVRLARIYRERHHTDGNNGRRERLFKAVDRLEKTLKAARALNV